MRVHPCGHIRSLQQGTALQLHCDCPAAPQAVAGESAGIGAAVLLLAVATAMAGNADAPSMPSSLLSDHERTSHHPCRVEERVHQCENDLGRRPAGMQQSMRSGCGHGAARSSCCSWPSQILFLAGGSRRHLRQHARTPHQSPTMTVNAMPRATMTNTPSLLDAVVPAARVRQMMGLGLYDGAGGRGAGDRGDGGCGGGEDMLAGLLRWRRCVRLLLLRRY